MAFQQNIFLQQSSSPEQAPNTDFAKSSWLHMPSTILPWKSEAQPSLNRFGSSQFLQNFLSRDTTVKKLTAHKRKSDSDFNHIPTKVHITDDKMAARMNNMHICSDQGFSNANNSALPSLVLSKEVQSFPCVMESILPESLIHKDQYSKALMVWTPPVVRLPPYLSHSKIEPEESENDDTANNNSSNPDLNGSANTGKNSSSPSKEDSRTPCCIDLQPNPPTPGLKRYRRTVKIEYEDTPMDII